MTIRSPNHYCAYVGGVSWRWTNATYPLVRLTLDQRGIGIRPAHRLLSGFLSLFGLADLHFEWSEIESVERRSSSLPPWLPTNGVIFRIGRRRLIWWSKTGAEADSVLAEARAFGPARLSPGS